MRPAPRPPPRRLRPRRSHPSPRPSSALPRAPPAAPPEHRSEHVSKTLWERTVELTIAAGERLLAPIERWIGRRSLVGDAAFFPLDRFPWVPHIEENWETIRAELDALLEHHAALPN